MNIPPVGLPVGAPLAQTRGSDVERAQHDVAGQERETRLDKSASDAAGIGATDGEDKQTEDRDADGRRLWEESARKKGGSTPAAAPVRQSRDTSGQSGHNLDLNA